MIGITVKFCNTFINTTSASLLWWRFFIIYLWTTKVNRMRGLDVQWNEVLSLSTSFHKHHLIPRHSKYFGTLNKYQNEESWIISLTIEGHACQHDILYRVFGCWQDHYAASGLMGIAVLPEEEIKMWKESSRFTGKKHTEEWKEEARQRRIDFPTLTVDDARKGGKKGGAKTRDSGALRKASVLGGKVQGLRNKGMAWYHQVVDGKVVRKRSKTPLPKPWIKGKG
jgi:hypothetical protein